MATGNPFVNIYVQVTGFSCEFKKKSLNILNSRRDRNTVHFRKKYWKIFIRSRHFAGKWQWKRIKFSLNMCKNVFHPFCTCMKTPNITEYIANFKVFRIVFHIWRINHPAKIFFFWFWNEFPVIWRIRDWSGSYGLKALSLEIKSLIKTASLPSSFKQIAASMRHLFHFKCHTDSL